jgi:dihydroflavonol-4-reductase
VAALLAAGHDVRLLVRSPDRIAPALRPLGVTVAVDHPVGDDTHLDSVTRALRGCDPVVHVSSTPVVIVHPGGVLGPHDPYCGDQARRLRDILRGRYPLWSSGGFHVVDVRDVARLHTAVMRPGAGPHRYLVPGTFIDGAGMYATLRALTGRRLPLLIVPSALMLPMTWTASTVQRVTPFHLPADHEGVLITRSANRCDDSRARDDFGIQPRPLAETYRDTIRWLHRTGRLTDRQVGRLAGDAPMRSRSSCDARPETAHGPTESADTVAQTTLPPWAGMAPHPAAAAWTSLRPRPRSSIDPCPLLGADPRIRG